MKLSKENIQFIDNYLKNSEVVYYDIRMEMLDHVSTAVEQKMQTENLDFYDAFKNYMVVNKKELMEQNAKTLNYNYHAIVPFLKYCLKPLGLSVFLLCYLFFFFVIQKYNLKFVCLRMIWTVILLAIVNLLIQATTYYFNQKKRYYTIEKNSVILIIVVQPLNFLNVLHGNTENVTLFEGILITFLLSWILVFFIYHHNEKKRIAHMNKTLFL